MNSATHVRVSRLRMEYAAETKRPGEYAVEAKYIKPSKKANLRTDRICFGREIDCAATKRQIARVAIAESKPT
jgi:hypothetical protein